MSSPGFTISWTDCHSEYGTVDTIRSALKARFPGTVYQDIPTASFIQYILRLDSSETETVTSSNIFHLREDSLAIYKEILTTSGKYTSQLHQPFREIVDALLKDVCCLFPEEDKRVITYLCDGLETTEDEPQLSPYALYSSHERNRHCTAGFLVDGFNISIWYHDETAAMWCVPFNFTSPAGIKHLALSLFALSQRRSETAGFYPYFYQINSPSNRRSITAGRILFKKFPGVDEHVCVIKNGFSRFRRVNGRGTQVLVLKKDYTGSTLSDTNNILKLGWQEPICTNEDITTARIRNAIPNYYDALPDPDIPLREGSESANHALEFNDRVIHVFVAKRFKNLWDVDSVDEFKRVFLDCLKCHHRMWNAGKVLHRNISDKRLVIHQPSDGADKGAYSGNADSALSRRVFVDFDMSSELDSDGLNARLTSHGNRAGTFAFMARDLLSQARNAEPYYSDQPRNKSVRPANCHLYRYDLESFYYMLIWATVTYKLRRRSRRMKPRTSHVLVDWLTPDPKVVLYAKLELQTDQFNKYGSTVSKGWEGLWKDWVVPLNTMFQRALSAADEAYREHDANFDAVTCNGMLTFERFMDAIEENPHGGLN